MPGTPPSSLQSHFSLSCDTELVINLSASPLSNAVAMGVNIDLNCAGFAFFLKKNAESMPPPAPFTSMMSRPHQLICPWSTPPPHTHTRHGRGMLGKIRPLQRCTDVGTGACVCARMQENSNIFAARVRLKELRFQLLV